ncbi:MAG: TFIIF-interacting CTD phosphatase-like protein [Natronomonas sp.]|jgi:TFIIF-interacting CTD phosphatase-like protein|uniref:hypothetical protein n=1 Tax=Natronomonas sp. TaxID=2184060 RepID=UPI0039E4DCE6
MTDEPLTIDELIEYCRIQAGLLSGRAETIGEEADALLDEIDTDIGDVRAGLEAHAEAAEPAETRDVSDLETLESDLEEKQAIVEAKQARMSAFQNLAAEYLELAETLDAEIDDWETALQRVVTFEREHDAPVYFDDRQTLYEAAAESDDTAE